MMIIMPFPLQTHTVPLFPSYYLTVDKIFQYVIIQEKNFDYKHFYLIKYLLSFSINYNLHYRLW